jgi:sulfhydrogenase subunit gamma (sulfur reductase)
MNTKTKQTQGAEFSFVPMDCTLESVSDLSPTEKLFRIKLPKGRSLWHMPGQFVQVSLLGLEEAPISISNSPTRLSGSFELGVRRAGVLTQRLHSLSPGASIGIRGPFGTFFDVERFKGKDILLISGGCGLAPMRSLIQYCEDKKDQFGKLTIIYGAKSPADQLYKQDLQAWDASHTFECHLSVDNVAEGTCYDGKVGLITTLIPPLQINSRNTIAVIVGPPVMYAFVIKELQKKGVLDEQIVVSLERYMRCGVGKCGHCVIDDKYCCLDGPVFWLNDIKKIKGAL